MIVQPTVSVHAVCTHMLMCYQSLVVVSGFLAPTLIVIFAWDGAWLPGSLFVAIVVVFYLTATGITGGSDIRFSHLIDLLKVTPSDEALFHLCHNHQMGSLCCLPAVVAYVLEQFCEVLYHVTLYMYVLLFLYGPQKTQYKLCLSQLFIAYPCSEMSYKGTVLWPYDLDLLFLPFGLVGHWCWAGLR